VFGFVASSTAVEQPQFFGRRSTASPTSSVGVAFMLRLSRADERLL
jgi:hypothetical protein